MFKRIVTLGNKIKLDLLFYAMCTHCICVCVCAGVYMHACPYICMEMPLESRKGALELLKLEWQIIVRCYVGAGNKSMSFARAGSALNHWTIAISSVPALSFKISTH